MTRSELVSWNVNNPFGQYVDPKTEELERDARDGSVAERESTGAPTPGDARVIPLQPGYRPANRAGSTPAGATESISSSEGRGAHGTCKQTLKAQYVARRLASQVAARLKNVLSVCRLESGPVTPFKLIEVEDGA